MMWGGAQRGGRSSPKPACARVNAAKRKALSSKQTAIAMRNPFHRVETTCKKNLFARFRNLPAAPKNAAHVPMILR
jgi:hypothetical protein